MHCPDQNQFLKFAEKYNIIPVYDEILADLNTPVSAYLKLTKKSKFSFLLESVDGEEKISRFSFVARNPQLVFKTHGAEIEISHYQKNRKIKTEKQDVEKSPLTHIRNIMSQYSCAPVKGLPPFFGGLVGYLGYDTVKFFEKLPEENPKDIDLPEVLMVMAKEMVIFDHLDHKIKLVSCVEIDPKSSQKEKISKYKEALSAIQELKSDLEKPLTKVQNNSGQTTKKSLKLSITSNVKRDEFEKMVVQAKKEIRAGEIIQVVLSQRFQAKLDVEPIHVYRALRSLNPSPYMYCLDFDGVHVVGASPELLVRCEQGLVETRPIAGTRPRGKNKEEDLALAEDLLSDPKEKAEHIMLVDLGRNDLGRVSKSGSVRLSEFMTIERYSHVMHIVSNVQGQLSKKHDNFDVLQAAFPAGTVSGAPKIRAMEIIEELENVARGPYAGCIGYFGFNGNLDSCITIRTIVMKDKKAYVQAGAGIVADSKPEAEYLETCNKAKAQLKALEFAQQLQNEI